MDNVVDNVADVPADESGVEAAAGAGTTDASSGDLAADILAGARETARTRPRRYDRDTRNRIRRENLAGRGGAAGRTGPRPASERNVPGYSGPGKDPDRDPHRLGGLLGDFVADQGWDRPLAQGRVFSDWERLVGPDIASHATPRALVDGELRIAAESTAWATQLRLLSASLLARLVAELGPDVVTKLHITGPAAPSWKHGPRSVRGHRGPRDTYG